MNVDPALMEILACPCPAHATLHTGTAADTEADALTCTACGRSFPVRDDIPVLLLDEVVPGTGPGATDLAAMDLGATGGGDSGGGLDSG